MQTPSRNANFRLTYRCRIVALVAAVCACSDAERSIASTAADGGQKHPPEADADASRLEREAEFWEKIAICGEPVEDFRTVTEMAESADAVVVGRIIGVAPGNTVQGDAVEDFYAEANLSISVEEGLDGTIEDLLEMSAIVAAATRETLASTVVAMGERLPKEPVVAVLRARPDFEDLYIALGDKGLWTRTARSLLDNPIAGNSCRGHYGEEVRQTFLEGAESLDELIEQLRP